MLYASDCCEGCDCPTVTAAAGDCNCGKARVAMRVVKIDKEAGAAMLCACGAECDCGGVSADDATKCGCGKELKTVDLKGTGLYACACEGDCCPVVSGEPGQCRCGVDLAQL